MNMKKTALATAVALTVFGGSVLAETSTVLSQFIADKTEIAKDGVATVNIALLGLNKDGEVDLYGEEKGSVIMGVVKSEIGEVSCGGSDHPGTTADDIDQNQPAGGFFAADVRYVRLIQGNGATCVTYDPDVIGTETRTDVVEMFLQERIPTTGGGVEFERIGEVVKRTITINPPDTNPEALRIGAFNPAPSDQRGVLDCFTDTDLQGNLVPPPNHCDNAMFETPNANSVDEGIFGEMMAGFEGGQILVWAKNPNAAGEVTLTLKSKLGSQEYSFTGRMISGEAIITLDSSVKLTDSVTDTYGDYYVEATMDGFDGSSVQLVYEDILRVWSTGDVRGLTMSADKTHIAKADFDNADVKAGKFPQLIQGAEVSVHLLDQYGNLTSNCPMSGGTCTESEVRIKVSDDTSSIVSSTAIDMIVPLGTWGMAVPNSKDAMIGNVANEIISVGPASLVARAVDNVGNTLSQIAASEPYKLTVVADTLNVTDVFSDEDKLAGVEFNFATVTIASDKGAVRTFQEAGKTKTVDPGQIALTNMTTGETLTINRKSGEDNPADEDVVKALFKKHSSGNYRYLVSAASGGYGQVWVDARAIIPAAAAEVELQDAHGNARDTIEPTGPHDKILYTTVIPEIALKMSDSFGNAVTSGTPRTDKTGEFFVNTPNGKVEYRTTEGNRGIPGRNTGTDTKKPVAGPGGYIYTHAVITYQGSGADMFAGQDNIEVQFTKPGLGVNTLTIKSNVPSLQELGSIVSSLETNSIPVNSKVALTVETLDTDGLLYDSTDNIVVTLTFGGMDGDDLTPTVTDNTSGKQVVSGQSVEFDTSRKVFIVAAGPRIGQFSLTFEDADGAVAAETRTIKVTREVDIDPVEPPVPDLDKQECANAGGLVMDGKCEPLLPINNPDGVGGPGVLNPDGTISETSDAVIKGGISVKGGTIVQEAVVSLADNDEVSWMGNIKFDPKDKGEVVDIIIVANYIFGTTGPMGGQKTVMTYNVTGGNEGETINVLTIPSPVDLVTLLPFISDHTVTEDGLAFLMYEGPFGAPIFLPGSVIEAYIGYRKPSDDGGQIIFNQLPITLRMLR